MSIMAIHRIITDVCRLRPREDIIKEILESVEKFLRGALAGWPTGENTKIHAKVEVELDETN